MRRATVPEPDRERASAAIAFVVAAGLALVVFVTLANLLVMQFTREAMRISADEAVRAGSRSDAPVAACEARARAVLAGLLGPAARGDATFACDVSGTPPTVHVHGEVTMVPWLRGLPEWRVTVRSDAVQEQLR